MHCHSESDNYRTKNPVIANVCEAILSEIATSSTTPRNDNKYFVSHTIIHFLKRLSINSL